jgi:small-conductance mechanosensitive channel
MLQSFLQNSSQLIAPLGRTVVTLGVAYVIGLVLRDLFVARLVRTASRTPGGWDDILVSEVRKRVPFWCLLLGAYFSIEYWPWEGLDLWHFRLVATLYAMAVASFSLAASSGVTRLVSSYGTRATSALPITSLTENLARLVVLAIGLALILDGFGIKVTGLLTTLGVAGLAVALALQEPLSNLFAGLFVTLAAQVRIGDYIKLDSGAEGYVIDFNWRSTRLQVPSGNVVIVPNSKLSQAIVTNFSLPFEDLAVTVDLAVDDKSDLDRVEKLTVEVAREVMTGVDGGVSDFVPVVRYTSLEDGAARFRVVMRARENGRAAVVKHEFLKRVQRRYEQEGVVLPAPSLGQRQDPDVVDRD